MAPLSHNGLHTKRHRIPGKVDTAILTDQVSEAGASDRDDILSMPEMRASGTGVLHVH